MLRHFWATEETDEDLLTGSGRVDLNLAIGIYDQNGLYDDGEHMRSIFRPAWPTYYPSLRPIIMAPHRFGFRSYTAPTFRIVAMARGLSSTSLIINSGPSTSGSRGSPRRGGINHVMLADDSPQGPGLGSFALGKCRFTKVARFFFFGSISVGLGERCPM